MKVLNFQKTELCIKQQLLNMCVKFQSPACKNVSFCRFEWAIRSLFTLFFILNFKFELFDLVTLDELDLTQDHKRFRRAQVSKTRCIPFHRLYFSLIRLLCPAKPAMTDNWKFDLWSDLWRHQWPSDELLQHILKAHARSYEILCSDREWVQYFDR